MVSASRAASACATFTVAARPVTAALPALPAAVMASLASVALTIVWSVPASGAAPPSAAASSWSTVRTLVAARSSTLTHVVAAQRVDVDALDAVEVHRDGPDVAVEPRARAVGRQPEAARCAPLPLKVIVSAPLRPSTMSLPSPGSQTKRSSPAPRLAMSLPPLPSITSAPASPLSLSAPRPPRSVSLPPWPSMRVGIVVGEGAVGVVDADLVVAAARLDADALDLVARDREVGRAVVADVDLELVGRAGAQAQREPVARAACP